MYINHYNIPMNAILGTTLSKPCQFPPWLRAHAQWFTLDGKVTYTFEPTSLRVMEGSEGSTLLTTAVCAQVKESQPEKLTLVLKSTTEWYAKYFHNYFTICTYWGCNRSLDCPDTLARLCSNVEIESAKR